MNHTTTELGVGLFVIAGIIALSYLSIALGDIQVLEDPPWVAQARFATVGDLKASAPVRLAGVKVGQVDQIYLKNYAAEVVLHLDPALKLPTDTIASIRTSGLLGESFVSLSPGAAEGDMKDGDRMTQTESPINLIDLIAKYAFGSVEDDDSPQGDGGDDSGLPDPF